MKPFFLIWFLRPLLWLLAFVLLLPTLVYLNTKIYDFPAVAKFSGTSWYNPYENCLPKPFPFKANFHAHSKAWGGITNGEDSEEDLANAYINNGYDVVGISNYHRITGLLKKNDALDFPVYEHGYNLLKSHRLAMGAESVTYFDYPLFQSSSHKQDLINRVAEVSKAVTIAHPKLRNGHNVNDLSKVVGYDFIEVLNHYRISDVEWDAALSAGRLAWIQADDDTHSIAKEPTFVMWNRIYSKSRKQEALIEAMKAGKSYAIHAPSHDCQLALDSCIVRNDSVWVYFNEVQQHIDFISDHHQTLYRVQDSKFAQFQLPDTASYVRIEGHQKNCGIYLNPIVRWDGENLPLASKLSAPVNIPMTILAKLAVVLFLLMLVIFTYKGSRWLKKVAHS